MFHYTSRTTLKKFTKTKKSGRPKVFIDSHARQEKIPCQVWMHQMLHQSLMDPLEESFLSPQARHAERWKDKTLLLLVKNNYV